MPHCWTALATHSMCRLPWDRGQSVNPHSCDQPAEFVALSPPSAFTFCGVTEALAFSRVAFTLWEVAVIFRPAMDSQAVLDIQCQNLHFGLTLNDWCRLLKVPTGTHLRAGCFVRNHQPRAGRSR